MASSQDIAKWVETYLITDGSWVNLEDAVNFALEKAMRGASIEMRTDLAEENLPYVEVILRNKRAQLIQDGGVPTYELDDNDSYIRRINQGHVSIAKKLRSIDPLYFEVVCKRILEKLGATAENTQKTYDGGVDFYALDMKTYSASYPLPRTAALTVIGQAKRYAEKNDITEIEIRKFIGGAILKLDELRKQGKVSVLSPVVFAFWTTSDLHIHAKEFSQKMGVWYLDGISLAEYILKLGLEDEIFPKDQESDGRLSST